MAKVEVHVEETTEEVESSSLFEATHKVLQAGLGAVVLAQEVTVNCLNKLIERGESVEQEGRLVVGDRVEKHKHQVRKVVKRSKEGTEAAKDELELRLEGLLGEMNVPTRNDIDALSAKITVLTEKVDELKKA